LADLVVRRCKIPFYVSEPMPDSMKHAEIVLAALKENQADIHGFSLEKFTRSFAACMPVHLERLRELVG
jgi:hypothetical protein